MLEFSRGLFSLSVDGHGGGDATGAGWEAVPVCRWRRAAGSPGYRPLGLASWGHPSRYSPGQQPFRVDGKEFYIIFNGLSDRRPMRHLVLVWLCKDEVSFLTPLAGFQSLLAYNYNKYIHYLSCMK